MGCELIGVVLKWILARISAMLSTKLTLRCDDDIRHVSLLRYEENLVVTLQSERPVVVCGIRFAASVSWDLSDQC